METPELKHEFLQMLDELGFKYEQLNIKSMYMVTVRDRKTLKVSQISYLLVDSEFVSCGDYHTPQFVSGTAAGLSYERNFPAATLLNNKYLTDSAPTLSKFLKFRD